MDAITVGTSLVEKSRLLFSGVGTKGATGACAPVNFSAVDNKGVPSYGTRCEFQRELWKGAVASLW